VLFVLPTASPITVTTFNYTIVAVGVVLLAAWLWWILSARNWFTGPQHTVDEPATPAGLAASEPNRAGIHDGLAPTDPS
jgi:hypothetical protein